MSDVQPKMALKFTETELRKIYFILSHHRFSEIYGVHPFQDIIDRLRTYLFVHTYMWYNYDNECNVLVYLRDKVIAQREFNSEEYNSFDEALTSTLEDMGYSDAVPRNSYV